MARHVVPPSVANAGSLSRDRTNMDGMDTDSGNHGGAEFR
jgi:hypothetical protein